MEIVSIVLQSLLALMFLMAGFGKASGNKMHVENFDKWRLPQWFRVLTGLVQLAAVVLLIVGYWDPSWVAAGALILSLVAIGGILTHVRAKDSFQQTFMILLLGIVAFVLLGLEWSHLADFPGFE
ncbi:DoxX family protein [Cohnella sp. GCM10027633]|uniref:DoxX family protein n=1 Tax=unclassified Cohnella TaxID=2636738 RepID=UPI003628AE56